MELIFLKEGILFDMYYKNLATTSKQQHKIADNSCTEKAWKALHAVNPKPIQMHYDN